MDNTGPWEIFLLFVSSGFLSIGGGNGPLVVIQNHWVSMGRLDPALVAWTLALSYLSPGPKVGFVTGVGYYLSGLWGAFAAFLGMTLPTIVGTAAVSYGLNKIKPFIQRITPPAGFVVAGLIAAAGWNMVAPLHLNGFEIAVAAFVTYLVGWKEVEPLWIVLGALGIGAVWSFL